MGIKYFNHYLFKQEFAGEVKVYISQIQIKLIFLWRGDLDIGQDFGRRIYPFVTKFKAKNTSENKDNLNVKI